MKKTIALFALCFVSFLLTAKAQPGGPRRTIEERVKMNMERLKPELKLDDSQAIQTDSALTQHYRGMDKLRAGMQQGERPDRSVYEKLTNERNEKFKKIFTAEQYKKFIEEIEPTMRRGGGGNRPTR